MTAFRSLPLLPLLLMLAACEPRDDDDAEKLDPTATRAPAANSVTGEDAHIRRASSAQDAIAAAARASHYGRDLSDPGDEVLAVGAR